MNEFPLKLVIQELPEVFPSVQIAFDIDTANVPPVSVLVVAVTNMGRTPTQAIQLMRDTANAIEQGEAARLIEAMKELADAGVDPAVLDEAVRAVREFELHEPDAPDTTPVFADGTTEAQWFYENRPERLTDKMIDRLVMDASPEFVEPKIEEEAYREHLLERRQNGAIARLAESAGYEPEIDTTPLDELTEQARLKNDPDETIPEFTDAEVADASVVSDSARAAAQKVRMDLDGTVYEGRPPRYEGGQPHKPFNPKPAGGAR